MHVVVLAGGTGTQEQLYQPPGFSLHPAITIANVAARLPLMCASKTFLHYLAIASSYREKI